MPAMDLPIRPRRNRQSPAVRALARETRLAPGDLIQPLFLHDGDEDQPIASMPGCTRWSLGGLVEEAGRAHELGIPAVVLFPAIATALKTPGAEECFNDDGLIPRAIRALKASQPLRIRTREALMFVQGCTIHRYLETHALQALAAPLSGQHIPHCARG